MNYQCLFFFSSTVLDVMEVKRLGMPKDSPPADVYQWLIIDHKKNDLIKLTFKSMESSGDLQKRKFVEADLQFNELKAILNWNDRIVDLVVKNPRDAVLDHIKLR